VGCIPYPPCARAADFLYKAHRRPILNSELTGYVTVCDNA
jgi:hypothetical protein